LDEELVMRQQAAYGAPGSAVDEGNAAADRKRKNAADVSGYLFSGQALIVQDAAEKPKRQKSKEHPKPDRKNSAVYVTSLPLDATVDEISSVFSKCGVIAEGLESGLPRIKLYQDDAGQPTGDALVVYFRPESVQLAIQMLDDTEFRFGVRDPMGNMRVKEADFSYKKQKEAPAVQNARDKQKIIRKAQKMTR
jgi:HIV Tat-specific factor 1